MASSSISDSVILVMVFIILPMQRIGCYVFTDLIVGFFISDYMFVIITLPDRVNICVGAKPFGNTDFKTTDDGTDGFRCTRPLGRFVACLR